MRACIPVEVRGRHLVNLECYMAEERRQQEKIEREMAQRESDDMWDLQPTGFVVWPEDMQERRQAELERDAAESKRWLNCGQDITRRILTESSWVDSLYQISISREPAVSNIHPKDWKLVALQRFFRCQVMEREPQPEAAPLTKWLQQALGWPLLTQRKAIQTASQLVTAPNFAWSGEAAQACLRLLNHFIKQSLQEQRELALRQHPKDLAKRKAGLKTATVVLFGTVSPVLQVLIEQEATQNEAQELMNRLTLDGVAAPAPQTENARQSAAPKEHLGALV